MLDGNVVSRTDVEEAVEELGKQAEGSGMTTKQVRALSAARSEAACTPSGRHIV